MEFKEFKSIFQQHVSDMLKSQNHLFVTDVDKDTLWETYLSSFPDGTNEVFRERREYDCSCCRHFIKSFGNVVAIKNNELVTIWDFKAGNAKFQAVIDKLSTFVSSASVKDVFVSMEATFGTDFNLEQLSNGDVHRWHHFWVRLPERFVTKSHETASTSRSKLRDARNVFERSLSEISKGAIETVLDLIAEETLYKGEEWQGTLTQFLKLHSEYHNLPDDKKLNYTWITSTQVSGAISKIRNHSIGVLLQNITDGMDIESAVRKYEHIVAPQNYKRPKEIFTKRMVTEAQLAVTRLGLLDSLGRRHAKLDDITINNVLWANKDAAKEMEGLGVFEALQQEVTVDPKQFRYVPGILIKQFIENVLPNTSRLEVLLENRHQASLVSLIAPKVIDSPTLFKWSNGFSWAYAGNMTDSIKERVKAAGGNVSGVLRFSLQWNDNHDNRNDFDAHCIEPNGNHIYFESKGRRHPSSGILDVDILHPNPTQVAVENITWSNLHAMQKGKYKFFVHNYSYRGGRSGFEAEIEYDGQLYEYSYRKGLAQGENVTVAEIVFSEQVGIEFLRSLPSTTSSKLMWGLKTNQFHPVSVCTFSPNYWDEQHGIGHQHHFFMLAGCKNDSCPNGFFNEYLKERFMEHKRVFAALGRKMKVEQTDNQLSGLGFSSTKRNFLICRTNNNQVVKVVF